LRLRASPAVGNSGLMDLPVAEGDPQLHRGHTPVPDRFMLQPNKLGPVHTTWMDGVASENRAKQFWARKAESESDGDPTAEGENAVWTDFRRNPQGRGQFSPCLRRCSLQ